MKMYNDPTMNPYLYAASKAASQTVEQVCRSKMRREPTVVTLGVSTGRPSGKRSRMTFSTDSEPGYFRQLARARSA
jgi:hypothetical protein